MNILKFLVFVIFVFHARSSNYYNKIIHRTDPDAKCLDGSDPMIYLHQGGDTTKFIFYFLGGGACFGTDLSSTLQSCYKRSFGRFGTSTIWEDYYDGTDGGILDPQIKNNKFANYTKIVIMYCDGAFHQGNNKQPIQYKDRLLYLRGAINTRSHIQWAHNKFNLSQSEQLIISGSSAGGIATYLWVDYFRTLVPNPQKVFGVSDSGIFYNPEANGILKNHLHSQKQTFYAQPNSVEVLMKISNTDEKTPNKQCSEDLPQQLIWKCIFIQYSHATLTRPILFIESSYDSYVIKENLKLKCLTQGSSGFTLKNCLPQQMKVINQYREVVVNEVFAALLKSGHSIWSISCSWHAQIINIGDDIYDSDLQRVPKQTGLTMRNAVESFILENKKIESIDFQQWPSNSQCAY